MNRCHITEIHEQAWLPTSIRDDITDALETILNVISVYRPIVTRLARAMVLSKTDRVVDLCSGGGGPWISLVPLLAKQTGMPLRVCLTDKFPNVGAFDRLRRQSNGAIQYFSEPVDAAAIPSELNGFRTIFSSFHHFEEHDARAILKNAVDNRQGVGIFEGAGRHPLNMLIMFFIPIGILLTVPFIRPFRWSLLLWTYIIPVIPFVLWFDGILSCLRAYTQDELREMIESVDAKNYTWELGKAGPHGTLTYLLGYPAQ